MLSAKKHIEIICQNCKRELIVPDNKASRARKYCSSRCFGKHQGFQKGHTPPFKDKHLPDNVKRKLSKANKGQVAWNKGLKGYKPPNPKRFKKGIIPWNKGKHIWTKERPHPRGGLGIEPWNKGLVGIHISQKTEFKKGHMPWWIQRGLENPTKNFHIKRKLSEKRKVFYRENPERHPNRIMAKKGFISKPQRKLFQLIKEFHADAELEFPIVTERGIRFADVGIPSLKIAFEYDSKYWHHDEKHDFERDRELKGAGWRVIRIKED